MSHFLTGLKKVDKKDQKKQLNQWQRERMVGPEDVLRLLILLTFSWAKIRNLPVWFRDATQSTIANLVCERSEPCSRMTALGRWVQ